MAAKMGRKDAYETKIKPRFDEIREWLINGANNDNIAHNLGVSKVTFYKYVKDKNELSELLKSGRVAIVAQLRSALIKKALGFEYSETKIIEREAAPHSVASIWKIEGVLQYFFFATIIHPRFLLVWRKAL